MQANTIAERATAAFFENNDAIFVVAYAIVFNYR